MTKPKIKFRDRLKGTEFEEGINNLISDSEKKEFGDLGKNGFEHSSKVEKYLNDLVPDKVKKKLNKFEIYVLLCAVYLHDIGYLKDGQLISKGHPERSYNKIFTDYSEFKELKEYGIDNEHKARPIALVCFGHTSEKELPLRKIPDKYCVDEWKGNLNLRFLSAILRLADDIDNPYTRVLGREEEKESMRSKVSGVIIDTERWRITFITILSNSEEWKKLDGMKRYTQERLSEIMSVIEPAGLLYDSIEIDQPENPFKDQEKQKSDIENYIAPGIEKPRIVEIMKVVLHPLNEKLDSNISMLNKNEFGYEHKNKSIKIKKLEFSFYQGIEEKVYKSFKEEYPEYTKKINNCDTEVSELKDNVIKLAEIVYAHDFEKKCRELLKKYNGEVENTQTVSNDFVDRSPMYLVSDIIDRGLTLYENNVYFGFWKKYGSELLQIREKVDVKEQIEKVEAKSKELVETSEELKNEIESLIKQYEKEYGICKGDYMK